MSDEQKARVVDGQITDVPMSWVNAETGNVEWITEFVLVYKSSGKCEVVPTPTATPNTPTIAQTIAKATGVSEEQVVKVLPNTGQLSSNWLAVAGLGLASVAGYMMFRNKRTGKTMLLAVIVAGGLGVSSTALASSAEFLQVVDNVKIELSARFSHTAPEDSEGCWEYVGYIPEIASIPRNGVPSVELPSFELPSLKVELPNDAPTHSIPELKVTLFLDPDGNELVPPVEGHVPPVPIDGYVPNEPIIKKGIKIYTYTPVTEMSVPSDAPTHVVPEATIETLAPVEEHGSVTAHYVDEQGNVIKDSNTFMVNELVNTINRVKITVNGVSTIEESVTPTGATYDAEPVKPDTINFEGKVYKYVEVKDGSADVEGTVPVGSTDVTFVYRHVPQVTTRQETSSAVGNVNVRYVDTNGNEIKDLVKLIENGAVSNTTTTITLTDGVETDRSDDVVQTGLQYDTKPLKEQEIEFNGSTYIFKELKQGDSEIGAVSEGTTTVTYIYDLAQNTTEVTSVPVYGNVVTRYVNELTGAEIVTGSSVVTQGIVANDVTTTVKNHKGEVVSANTVRTPTGLTYDTTADKAQKDAEIAQLRTPATEYLNTVTGEVVTEGDTLHTLQTYSVYRIEGHYTWGEDSTGWVKLEEALHPELGPKWLKVDEDAIALANGLDVSTKQFIRNVQQYITGSYAGHLSLYAIDGIDEYYFSKLVEVDTPLTEQDVPYEYTRVDTSEIGEVIDGTITVTYYYYKPSRGTYTPPTPPVDDSLRGGSIIQA